jgi:hypothetical protein
MHDELERLRTIERLVINTRVEQEAGRIPNNAPLPNELTSLLPPIDTSIPRRRANSVTTGNNVTRQILGGRRRKTRRRKIRRRKTKRAKN